MSALKARVDLLALVDVDGAAHVLPSRLELKRPAGSFSAAPFAKVSFTTFL